MPGKEAGSGCLCLFRMWRREDRGPGTGLGSAGETERVRPTAPLLLIPLQRDVTFIAWS